jgi:hypothetical protein
MYRIINPLVVSCEAATQGPRTPLVISVSEDEGKTWRQAVVLEEKPPPTGFDRILALDTVSLAFLKIPGLVLQVNYSIGHCK